MNILMPLPAYDFDPTEVCVTWQVLTEAGHAVVFATPDGRRAHADRLMVTGEGLDVWGWIPGLKKIKLLGLMLRAQLPARQAYGQLQSDGAFLQPLTYAAADAQARVGGFDALVLPGGHAKGMRTYLESAVLQGLVAYFFDTRDATGQHKPIGAVCHGVLLAARSISPVTGRSVLYGHKTTALTWDLERSAWNLTRWWARFWDPLYYRTYFESADEPAGFWSVEAEVKRALANEADFCDVPKQAPNHWRKSAGMVRDCLKDARAAWVVQDGTYVSARWPGDVYTFAQTFTNLLQADALHATRTN